ncbi:hypothetical protein J7624_09630 [Wohlfahrtiimonas chitiniclastica]|uniref:pyocin knob domain-containing protein n=1 Tax=Wohlfahrtiimonas chitiniclastica TaxID=400946 RepID=UPI000B98D2EE|nr:pyocin knob domain-containing protein [Wohlfahrtiimonas chitiniclastica]MBS7827402.1 hypothetical protein [Wohlfahrtiimonas chitiniclastica]OYQ85397.1 hypothetical protein B9T14_02590 [Wohlfahrtiimonas chitiniclastica]OYQ86369.1 hypothetical protein B9T15_02445 [Wohlfahrtiimonas chitiniclastica]
MPEILKNIKAEDRLKKIRIVSENDDVMGGQPEADGMKENDNNAIFDLACSVMHALAEVAKVDQKAIPQILDALGDSRTAGASQRIVNEVNKLAKAAQTAANQANDKANTANTAAATADKKAVAAQNTANSANAAAQKAQTTADTAFKLLGDLKTINLDTLNSNDKCGVYYQTANANATPERNYPIQAAGTLEVFVAAGVTQRYTRYNDHHDVYIRNNSEGEWDAWTKIPNASDLIKVSDAFGDSRTLAGSQRTINEANRSAKAAQTAANQANDKANTAQSRADSAHDIASTAIPNNKKTSSFGDSEDLVTTQYLVNKVAVERPTFKQALCSNGRRVYEEMKLDVEYANTTGHVLWISQTVTVTGSLGKRIYMKIDGVVTQVGSNEASGANFIGTLNEVIYPGEKYLITVENGSGSITNGWKRW